MGWFNDYVKEFNETDEDLRYRSHGVIAPGGEHAQFFDPQDDGHKAETFFKQHQGLSEIVTLRTEDVEALLNGKVLCVSVNGEYAIAVSII